MMNIRNTCAICLLALCLSGTLLGMPTNMNAAGQTGKASDNPFDIFYFEPREVTAAALDEDARVLYIGCEYGLIAKNIDNGKFHVVSSWEGLDELDVKAITPDGAHHRLFVLVGDTMTIHVVDTRTMMVTEKLALHSGISMMGSVPFKFLTYDARTDQLFLGSDAGIAAVNITTAKFDFYDLFFFDMNMSRYEIVNGTLYADLTTMSIDAMDLDTNRDELYIGTSQGLTVFDIMTKRFTNHRDGRLAGAIYAVDYVEPLDRIFISMDRIVSYDPASNKTLDYPLVIPENETIPGIINNLVYDPVHKVEYGSSSFAFYDEGEYSVLCELVTFVAFNTSFPTIDMMEDFEGDDASGRPEYMMIKHMLLDGHEGRIHLIQGKVTVVSNEWSIEYNSTSVNASLDKDSLNLWMNSSNKHLNVSRIGDHRGIGYNDDVPLIWEYSLADGTFRAFNITEHGITAWESTMVKETLGVVVVSEADATFLRVPIKEPRHSYETIRLDNDGKVVERLPDTGLWDTKTKDGRVYALVDGRIAEMNITSGQFIDLWPTEPTRISTATCFDIGAVTGRFYLGNATGIVIYDPASNTSTNYTLDLWEIENGYDYSLTVTGIAVDPNEEFVYLSHSGGLFRLNLLNGSFETLEDFSSYQDVQFYNDRSMLITNDDASHYYYKFQRESNCPDDCTWYGPMVLQEVDGSYTMEMLTGFPLTGTISSMSLDQTTGKLYAVTGTEKSVGGSAYTWAYSTDLPEGLIIYDIPSQTYENYSIENGLPSGMLTSVVVDPVNHRVHITGEGFYAVADEGALSGRRPAVKVTAVLPTTRDQPVLGITGDTGPSGKETIWLEERTYIGIAGLASGLMVIGLAALHEPFKYKVVAAVAIPLFTRIKKEEVLDHETRGRIRGHIESDPGIHYNELLRKLGLNNGTLAYHLQVLEREGYIVSRNSGVYRFYFPFNMSIPAHPFRLKPVQRMMLGKIMERPGISQKELAKVTGTKRSTVNYNVKILVENGFVLLVRKGNTTECYIVDEDGKARTERPAPGKEEDADGAGGTKGDDPA